MIESIQLIRNIGRFDTTAPGPQLPFSRLTLIHAENARGKTTLSAIMRSLSSGEARLIRDRHRLAAAHQPHVIINLTGAARCSFQNNAWSANLPTVTVFDDTFVAENICSGIEIDAEHRQNLHEFILGGQGVILNRSVQGHVVAIEEHNRQLRIKGDAIPAATRGNLTVDQFCALKADERIARRLIEGERNLAAAESADAIERTPVFSALELPAFDADAIDVILSQSIADLDAVAAEQVQIHFAQLGAQGETWIAEGISLVPAYSESPAQEKCPFCCQSLAASEIFQHYRAYFGAAYTALKERIASAKLDITIAHDGNSPAAFERAIRVACERREFWSRFADIPEIGFDTDALATVWKAAREAVDTALAAKQAAPLEASILDENTRWAIEQYHGARAQLIELSSALLTTNAQLATLKESTQTANVKALLNELTRLQAIQARNTPEISALCNAYLAEKQAKVERENLRDTARANLHNYRQNVFPAYQSAINRYLYRFGASFRLHNMNSVNNRGGSSATYSVLINETEVPLTAAAGPSFRSALSSGDRNTLALAFYFVSIENDPGLSDRILVIDDPMTSLDEHRSLVTVQEIINMAGRVSQVIVLSHSKAFLLALWNASPRNICSGMCITRVANGSVFDVWNVNGDCFTEHDRRFARVRAYLRDADQDTERQVASDLRPMLEASIRITYPEEFPPGSLLGPFIRTCQERLHTANPILNADKTRELRELLDFANRFHHDPNQAWHAPLINDQELTIYAQRTIQFIQR